eukprot:scaffold8070_cov112-Isochrysis_galbana.AAC.2
MGRLNASARRSGHPPRLVTPRAQRNATDILRPFPITLTRDRSRTCDRTPHQCSPACLIGDGLPPPEERVERVGARSQLWEDTIKVLVGGLPQHVGQIPGGDRRLAAREAQAGHPVEKLGLPQPIRLGRHVKENASGGQQGWQQDKQLRDGLPRIDQVGAEQYRQGGRPGGPVGPVEHGGAEEGRGEAVELEVVLLASEWVVVVDDAAVVAKVSGNTVDESIRTLVNG